MRYEAKIQVYDVLDMISIGAAVWTYADEGPRLKEVITKYATLVPGEGEPDPLLWLAGALRRAPGLL